MGYQHKTQWELIRTLGREKTKILKLKMLFIFLGHPLEKIRQPLKIRSHPSNVFTTAWSW